MAYPNFSEFSFGYGATRYYEEALGGRCAVPTYPTQHQEQYVGYDVDFLAHGVPFFVQYKRSEVMERRNCVEFKEDGNENFPIFRMHLHRANNYRQHFLMQWLEAQGNLAVYCTSSFRSKSEMDSHYAANTFLDGVQIFLPSEIIIPSYNQDHHVSFNKNSPMFRVYSKWGVEGRKRYPSSSKFIDQLKLRASMPVDEELIVLRKTLEALNDLSAESAAQKLRRRNEVKFSQRQKRVQGDESADFMGFLVDSTFSSDVDSTTEAQVSAGKSTGSVVQDLATKAFYEADAFLMSASREALLK